MTAVIDGQLSIFDWMEDFDPAKEATPAAGYPALDDIPEEKAIKIIGDRIGVNFTWNSFFERYEAKVGKITLDAGYDHYSPGINDGRLMLSIGYNGKNFGGGKPSDSIEEAIDYFEKYKTCDWETGKGK